MIKPTALSSTTNQNAENPGVDAFADDNNGEFGLIIELIKVAVNVFDLGHLVVLHHLQLSVSHTITKDDNTVGQGTACLSHNTPITVKQTISRNFRQKFHFMLYFFH